MRIGIDCRTILNPKHGERAGVGHYTYNLVRSLLAIDHENEYVLLFDDRFDEPEQFQQTNVKIRTLPFYQYKKFLPFTYAHLLIASILNREKLDVYHAPANVIPYMYNRPSVVTVHDLAIYEHPEWFPRGQTLAKNIFVPQSLKKAKQIIAVSQHTKQAIRNLFKLPANRISVIYPGVDNGGGEDDHPRLPKPEAVYRRLRVREPFLLFVGTMEPRKNIVGLIQAFKAITDEPEAADLQLVIAGHKGWKSEGIFQAINRFGIARRLRYVGYVSHEEKLLLLKKAQAFVFPSFHEGFGLPILEAMTAGTPVLTSNVTAMPEVAGQAAVLVDPTDKAALTQALRRLVRNQGLRERLIAAGRQQAAKFSWTEAARQTITLYQRAATIGKRSN